MMQGKARTSSLPSPPAAPEPTTPQEIRELLLLDLPRVADRHLLAVTLSRGSMRRGPKHLRKNWSTLELAAALVAETGGRFADLAEAVCSGRFDFDKYGIGKIVGARLVAVSELASRFRLGLSGGGDSELNPIVQGRLADEVFYHRERVSEAALVAVMLSQSWPADDFTRWLMEAFGSPEELIRSLSLEAFEVKPRKKHVTLRREGREIETSFASGCQLIAGIELIRRYKSQAGLTRSRLGEGAFGLRSAELVRLLDPGNPLDSELRESLIAMLRSHPDLSRDFARLDTLARDAGTTSYQRAVGLYQMFEELRSHRSWTHPGEVLGDRVPYASLLAIADARIARATRPPVRLLEVQKLLRQAEQEATEQPIAGFVESLLALRISEAGAEKALQASRQAFLERRGGEEEVSGIR